ncbi:tripartite tricarboxylate transporter substrate binding protein [Oceanobacillus halophilus]|uniref:Tripartite tricarboxylate transporter substrate binding protein n=1 Tax=Oceanobacillus halophilus TaxID=930130 RepID=A0A495A7Y5_9BACI|nr:tripartite tricarboxylate transporter substrate binding protein [Oceanobacillus halophilus]RKQ35734.1 tripartite tricarboxylate transporter substrate binding protein [Oceanobacillus halophilus]
MYKKIIFSVIFVSMIFILIACSEESSSGGESDYPKRPVTLMIPYGAGGTTDLYFREFISIAEEHLGQRIIIKNETGGGGLSMYSTLSNAEPDGYTVAGGMGTSLFAINPHLDLMEQDEDDFILIRPVMEYMHVIAASKDAPFQTFEELIEYSKDNEITYASSSTTNALMAELINQEENFELQWETVNYSSAAETTSGVLGGHVDFTLDTISAMLGSVQSGDINVLAVIPDTKLETHPDVPTLKELGYDFDMSAMIGVGGPSGLPENVIEKWEDVISKTMEDPRLEDFAKKNNYILPDLNTQEVKEYFDNQRKQFGQVIDRVVE